MREIQLLQGRSWLVDVAYLHGQVQPIATWSAHRDIHSRAHGPGAGKRLRRQVHRKLELRVDLNAPGGQMGLRRAKAASHRPHTVSDGLFEAEHFCGASCEMNRVEIPGDS